MIGHRLPCNDPPETVGRVAQNEVIVVNDVMRGGARGAVGAPRFGRGWLLTLATE